MSVPVSLCFDFPHSGSTQTDLPDFISSINRELYYWRSCKNFKIFRFFLSRYEERYVKDIDLWVHFATKVANVEDFTLRFHWDRDPKYEFPQFAYKNTSLTSLILVNVHLNSYGSVKWTSLVYLSIASLNLSDNMLKKVLSGCPNLVTLHLSSVLGICRLEISSVKLAALSISDHYNEHGEVCLEILAPHLQYLELIGFCGVIRLQQRNLASLVSADLLMDFDDLVEERHLEKEYSFFKELLHSVAHVKNLVLGPWCIECMSILELKGWQSAPSSRKFLKLDTALEQVEFPGICSFLQSSSYLETLVIDWYNCKRRDLLLRYTNEDEQRRRFETDNFDCSLLHLKTIKIVNFHGPQSGCNFILSLVKYFLRNAPVLENFIIAATVKGSDVSQDYVKMEQEFQNFPRSSPQVSVSFSLC